MTQPIRVFLVEDNPGDARLVREFLKDAQGREFILNQASTLASAIEMLGAEAFDLALLDLSLPDSQGLSTFSRIQERFPELPVIVLTGFEDESTAIGALNIGAQDYLVKGQVDSQLLERSIAYAVERSRVQREVRRQRDLYETLLRVQSDVGEGVCILENGRLVFANRAFCAITARERDVLLDSEFLDLCDDEDRKRVDVYFSALDESETVRSPIEFNIAREADKRVVVDLVARNVESGSRKRVVAILRDMTEQKRMIAQILRAQRVESIGTLASGIAHDLNNSLTPVLTGGYLLASRIGSDPDTRYLLDVMVESAKRSADMIKQLLAFARGVEGQRIVLRPDHLVVEIQKLLSKTLPRNITLSWNLDPHLWPVFADATQLHQVLMNLCINARDAMPAGGTLTILAENAVLDEHYVAMSPGAKPGQFVRITVADTGVGIAPEIIPKLFDPFFTTKGQGLGTGLGLYTTYGIVQSHGGFITVYSEPRQGAQFQVYLPAADSPTNESEKEPPKTIPEGNGQWILIVDDEASIREIISLTLTAHRYSVLTARDGVDALRLFEDNCEKISVVLTDLMMPGMDGATLIESIKRIKPSVHTIASSGLSHTVESPDLRLLVDTILTKPYTAATLLNSIASLLEA